MTSSVAVYSTLAKRKSLLDEFPDVMDRAYKQHQRQQLIFYFYTEYGNYTGRSAQSLPEFAEAIAQVDEVSLAFHLYGGDFERWITEKGFPQLATQFRAIRRRKVKGEPLRQQLSQAVRTFLRD